MKKIGLVCNYYILNYGSVLQCYATEKIIKELGYDVVVIQFPNVPTTKAKIQLFLRLKLKRCFNLKAVVKKIGRMKNNSSNQYYMAIRQNRKKKFDNFVQENLTMSDPYSSLEEVKRGVSDYDAVVLGSDQLLNPKDIIFGYHTLAFVPQYIKKVSYAASFGLSSLPLAVRRKAKKELDRFDCFAAREIAGAKIYKQLTGKDVPVVVDPTLLFSRQKWREMAGSEPIIKEKYIYCYFIGDNLLHRQIAKELQAYTGYKIVSIRHIDEFIKSDENFGDVAVNDAGPKEFINLIANAEYVLADSFHATIFSIIFQRKFFVLNRFADNSSGSTNSRLDSLLGKLRLEERRISSIEDLKYLYKKEIAYNYVDEILDKWVSDSKEYFRKALER